MITGRVWKFGDDINTDLMLPGPLLTASEEEQRRAVFSANRPGWVDEVQMGDVIIGGAIFGTGSSRPAARSLRNLGLGALVAGVDQRPLFFRNAVSFGFLAFECPHRRRLWEGHTAEIAIDTWSVRNRDTGAVLSLSPVPEQLLSLMTSGGIYPLLEKQGLIAPKAAS
jgi:3-isopropylmalate/(R)-2-methylmalate dehydratase small subunit